MKASLSALVPCLIIFYPLWSNRKRHEHVVCQDQIHIPSHKDNSQLRCLFTASVLTHTPYLTSSSCRNSSLSQITQNTLLTPIQSSPALNTELDTISSHLVVWPNTMGLPVRSPRTILHVRAQYKQIRSLLINTFNLNCLRMEKGNASICQMAIRWDCNRRSAVQLSLYKTENGNTDVQSQITLGDKK